MNNTNQGTISKPLLIELEGRGTLRLHPKDYVVSGGEGAIYRPMPDTIIKLYHDREKMRREGLPEKIGLLARISSPLIVNPKGLVFEQHQPIGYYMHYEEGESLAKTFTNQYRQREGFTDKDAISLVEGMRGAVQAAHASGAVLVDPNELNWLVQRKKNARTEPRLIDVDSWKIDRWDATVIMPSIRDWHTKGFSIASDWFSWGVVSFQVFAGIHPFKGNLQGYRPNDFEARMKANKSVFHPGVRLNNAVRDFSCIPGPLLQWYRDVFEAGLRSEPPSPRDRAVKSPAAAITKRAQQSGPAGMLVVELLMDASQWGNITHLYPSGILQTDRGNFINTESKMVYSGLSVGDSHQAVFTDYGHLLVSIAADGSLLPYLLKKDGTTEALPTVLRGKQLLRYQNRLFVVGTAGLVELGVMAMGGKMNLITRNTWQVLLNSTRWFDGVGIQDALGAMFLVAPFGEKACAYLRVPELDGCRVVSAVAGTRHIIVVVLDSQTGRYLRYDFVMDSLYKTYTMTVSDIDGPALNLTLLPVGKCVSIPDDGQLFITVPTNKAQQLVQDRQISSSVSLAHLENRVVYIDGNKVWTLRLRN